ncbi:starch synthase (maltosyl-transferring) [Rhodoligotrophos appendicifer]|uniref:alpha-1,4-glucan--maltose-1-phosphate maltosyltransferase n=1 Tax=Rhodoligotrophos appendicifer TaxID=987056 RepID=UPI0014796059|nr:alpha-1,4-glucan--maltose-1-phosphate maltosyltransferase [Rhodoligotrophos appendicifer]
MLRLTPRIYGFNPLLAGPASSWGSQFQRIAAMGFDALHIDPSSTAPSPGFFEIGIEPHDLHRLVRGEDQRTPEDILAGVVEQAGREGLAVLVDIAIAPEEPARLDLFGDRAEESLSHIAEQITRAKEMGVAGFRCRRAHAVPAWIWSRLKQQAGDAILIADTLPAAIDTTLSVLQDGSFDLVFNSSAWWDFRQEWAFTQYDQLRRLTPTIAFPEDVRTGRLSSNFGHLPAAEIERLYRQRYLFAIGFSAGVWCPMGFEFGLRSFPHAAEVEEGHWERHEADKQFDLSSFIRDANALKSSQPALAQERLLRPVVAPDNALAGFLRLDQESDTAAENAVVVLINPTGSAQSGPGLARILAAAGGRFESFDDVTPSRSTPSDVLTPHETVLLRGAAAAIAAARPHELSIDDLAEERIAIEAVSPEIDFGRFPAKRLVGDVLTVEADIFSDGHDVTAAALLYREPGADAWIETPMTHVINDRWSGSFQLSKIGRYDYRLTGWKDNFGYWQYEVGKKQAAGVDVGLELREGLALVREAMSHADGPELSALEDLTKVAPESAQIEALMSPQTMALMRLTAPRANLTTCERTLQVIVERRAAAVSAWYELMPRSQSGDVNRHGTFDDVISRLPYVRDMGFDVLYFPPIHPIGRKNRKGRNNTLTPSAEDPGSPYAIGSAEGGHDALHPELGSFEDFERLVIAAREHGLEIALDFAIQCSPDHPWIKEHPEWFDWRPDGTIKYAENPPKKYEDIINVHFYRGAYPDLWYALRDVVLFWATKGVKIFRVDNPHTKPFPFWEWMIREVQDQHPDAIFLAEAFTRPKVMKRLAKLGFTQSYSYFTWRNTKYELTEYLTELTTQGPEDYMRPNFFTNTPDINPVYLQTSGRAGFQARLVLAATLSTVYGIYSGFELCEAAALPGREEYLDSEKYEIRAWDWERPGNIRGDVAIINRIRKDNPALWEFANLRFLNCWNDNIIAYYKITESLDNCVVIAVNLDPHNVQSAAMEIPLWALGLPDGASIEVVDLVDEHRFTWSGKTQTITLDPGFRAYSAWRLVPPVQAM